MIRVLSSTTPAQARGRRIHRASSGSAASTTPAWRNPRKTRVSRVGYELFTTAPSRPIIDTGYGPAHTSATSPTAPTTASSSRRPVPASRPSSHAYPSWCTVAHTTR